jgi:hypothetical protein
LKYRAQIISILLLCLISTLLVSVRETSAIPAWARKYNADCAMCHYAAYPRLNSFGLQFRRMGYRTPVEINKDQEISNVNNFLAGRIRSQFAYDNTRGTKERTEFRTPEISLLYGGAFSRHFSGYARASGDGSSNVSFTGQIIGLYGNTHDFVTVRMGQMPTLLFNGVGGFDRPVGLSVPTIYASPLTRNSSPTTLPTLNVLIQGQRGAELSYVHGSGRLFALVTNGFDNTGSATARTGDIDPQKDFLVGYDYILDEIASGFSLFYYNGTTHGSLTTTAQGVPVTTGNTMSFSRFGINVNKIFTLPGFGFFELMGGYVRSFDNTPAPPPVGRTDVQGNAGYIETQQYITGPELTFYERFSIIDFDAALKNSTRKDYTIGVVTPVETWLRLGAEYTYTENAFAGQSGQPGRTAHVALLEVQAAW